ncbi:type III polyketide synthase [Reichenbachiella carrageenanivorans]|uniref:Type III polyketide synthase n=1 Tax=Reichenbachiella carrageenanivorans TaxID=2979869 RepID=A0ABY6D230_9BACT|nr:type III polyketide synthase [Reichenbachiella carrageenanivorans]UXX80183.1 type III polyketide synthase [Reichenbachiella carrageenanivorans]
MGAYITAIGTANPANRYAQEDLAHFMCKHLTADEQEAKKLQVLYRATGIQYRHSVLDDYKKQLGTFSFYPNHAGTFPSTEKRMAIYREKALPLAISAITDCLGNSHPFPEFTHLITVSCTGMYAPGLDVDLVKALNLSANIRRNSLNFMGCYAAMNAMGMAKDICDNHPVAQVLIVSVELCSLHLQKEQTEDNLLAHSLFADGAAAVVVKGQSAPNEPALAILHTASQLLVNGQSDMAWQIGNTGFQMALTAYVPKIIEGGISALTHKLMAQTSLSLTDIDAFAIHPGGKKILETIETELGLSKQQNAAAYEVLRNYGNMSSPTVLFVLKKVWSDLKTQPNKQILSFAFGPGLTMESLLFKTI